MHTSSKDSAAIVEPEIPTVFISYAWADRLSAFAIDQWLRDHNARVLIDQRDFIPGNDLEDEIVRCIKDAGKVVCIYSRSSANRPYPELERRIAASLEREDRNVLGKAKRRLVYFCIDTTPLPTEVLPRLAIMARDLSFEGACQELWRSILETAAPPRQLNLAAFSGMPPWKTPIDKDVFDLTAHSDSISRFYKS